MTDTWTCPQCKLVITLWPGVAKHIGPYDHEAYACPMSAHDEEEIALRIGRRDALTAAYPKIAPRVVGRRDESGRLRAVLPEPGEIGVDLSTIVQRAEYRRWLSKPKKGGPRRA